MGQTLSFMQLKNYARIIKIVMNAPNFVMNIIANVQFETQL